MKQLNVDDKSSVHEMPFIMELWRSVKYGALPETVYLEFFPSEQLPKGRTVRVTIEVWNGTLSQVQGDTLNRLTNET